MDTGGKVTPSATARRGFLDARRRSHAERMSAYAPRYDEVWGEIGRLHAALFDAVVCIDALENVGPEDWPVVVDRLRAAARPRTRLYVTVDRTEQVELEEAYRAARERGDPVVPGELFDGVGYHYYPAPDAVRTWLTGAGVEIEETAEDDDYAHYLLGLPG